MLSEAGEKMRQEEQLQVQGQQTARDEPRSRGHLHIRRPASFQQGRPSSSFLELGRVQLVRADRTQVRVSAETGSRLPTVASARPFCTPPCHGVPVAFSLQPHDAGHASYHPGSVFTGQGCKLPRAPSSYWRTGKVERELSS